MVKFMCRRHPGKITVLTALYGPNPNDIAHA